MTKQPEALRLADALDKGHYLPATTAAELRRLHEVNAELLGLVKDLQESASYWSEYDVPLLIVDRINAAVQKAAGEAE
jgi:hypothetical protein